MGKLARWAIAFALLCNATPLHAADSDDEDETERGNGSSLGQAAGASSTAGNPAGGAAALVLGGLFAEREHGIQTWVLKTEGVFRTEAFDTMVAGGRATLSIGIWHHDELRKGKSPSRVRDSFGGLELELGGGIATVVGSDAPAPGTLTDARFEPDELSPLYHGALRYWWGGWGVGAGFDRALPGEGFVQLVGASPLRHARRLELTYGVLGTPAPGGAAFVELGFNHGTLGLLLGGTENGVLFGANFGLRF